MILIVDANIVMSALLKEGKSRELLTLTPFILYSPDTLLESIEKYKDEFIQRMRLTREDFQKLLNFLLRKITIVKQEEYSQKLEQANQIFGNIDIGDVPYIALALSIENDGIWSDDAHFQEQNNIKIYKTEEIIKILGREDEQNN